MDRHLCFAVLFSVCSLPHCFASLMNDHELVILASQLSDKECRKLILVLYKKPAYELAQANRYTGDCDRDLERWLQSKEEEGDSLALEELQHTLGELGRPALGQRIAVEVFDEVDQNLEDFIDKDGLLIDKDIMSKGNDGHND
ncbi:uncharacterized protein [Asterias amurensis]|uniref:uncharacterized protein n=1 Tax=Asterias amurensis TaxID=7602 RepID=UPI003AB8D0BB